MRRLFLFLSFLGLGITGVLVGCVVESTQPPYLQYLPPLPQPPQPGSCKTFVCTSIVRSGCLDSCERCEAVIADRWGRDDCAAEAALLERCVLYETTPTACDCNKGDASPEKIDCIDMFAPTAERVPTVAGCEAARDALEQCAKRPAAVPEAGTDASDASVDAEDGG